MRISCRSLTKVPLILLFLPIPIFLLLFSCCTSPTIWGYPVEEFYDLLRSEELPQLAEMNVSALSLDELENLGAGGALFLSYFPFADSDAALQLRRYEAENGEEPYASFAARLLVKELSERRAYQQLLTLEDDLGPRYGNFYPWRRAIVTAAYWHRQDERALVLLQKLIDDFPDQTEGDQELVLLKTVLRQRTGDPDWKAAFIRFFQDYPAGPYHVRAWDYLRIEDFLEQFSEDERRLLRGVDLVARGERARGFALLHELVSGSAFSMYLSPGLLHTLAAAADTSAAAGNLLELYSRISTENPRFSREISELSAFLLRREGRHREAHSLFSRLAEDGDQRFLWYAFSSLVRSNTAAALKELPFLVAAMQDPAYFRDILADFCQQMARYRNWDGIVRAYRVLDGSVGADILSPYAYIAARASQEGISRLPLDLEGNEILERLARGEYPGRGGAVAPDASPDPYYRLLAAADRGIDSEPESVKPQTAHSPGRLDPLVAGLLDYGLVSQALELTEDAEVSEYAAAGVVQALYREERYEEGLRLLLKRSLPMERLYFYPRPFKVSTETQAENQGIPPWLLFSLMRQESLFNPAAVSHAGAMGLTQLMPATARDVARRLRLENPGDLFDPYVNLQLGAWYLRHMMDRTDNLSDALASYNAGITRLRRWRQYSPRLPDDLFLETIPFQETRDYVKLLLVSSWHYGYLYYHVRGEEIVFLFFPRM
ncbi:flagellar assembly lytic transglycosylase [Marispirochaeta sp.]|uniref:flagellar assembly lytic transglycosylase n=1 Tax=Marispirochaeta sp. TaxID=2038653 RepID=UPI0029C8AEBC|nr:lytic transglycosylase domain-containing protein [Marispirochaeta sp.]